VVRHRSTLAGEGGTVSPYHRAGTGAAAAEAARVLL